MACRLGRLGRLGARGIIPATYHGIRSACAAQGRKGTDEKPILWKSGAVRTTEMFIAFCRIVH